MLQAGDVLAERYLLRERVGGGGMGDVWRGEDKVLGRTVAVKVLLSNLSNEPSFHERFRREARAIAGLEAPGIVDVYDYGEVTGERGTVAFLIMQFVEGMSLSRRLAGWGRLHTNDTMQLVSQVAEALQVAHEAGIIHRDVKPGNILLKPDGRVILVDFGIARTCSNLTMTTTGVVLGTVAYMSPEQASGEPLSAASDIYSLGVVAYQCLSGQPPFKAATPLAVLSAHLRDVPARLPSDVPQPVPQLITRAMAKEPAQRWHNAAEFAQACRSTTLEYRPVLVPDAPAPPHPPLPPAQRAAPASAPIAPSPPAPPAEPVGAAAPPRPRQPPQQGIETDTDTDTETPEDAQRPKRSRARRVMYLVGVTAVIIALTAILSVVRSPWDTAELTQEQSNTPAGEIESRSSAIAEQQPAPGEGADDEHKPSKDPGDDATRSHSDANTPGDEPSSAPTSDAQTPDMTTVPNVMSHSESSARSTLENARLRPAITYEGEGDVTCSVIAQSPDSGTEISPGSTVTLTIQRVTEACQS